MLRCPAGHPTAAVDYCDVCGLALPADEQGGAGHECVRCRAALPVGSRFCERCGAEQDPARWSLLVGPDREYFDRRSGDRNGLVFPASTEHRRVALEGPAVRIGRRSASRGLRPEVDLAEPPRDPGVSREHAVLLARPDGTWTVMDLGSANGTFVNDGPQRLSARHEVALADGDRIHVGVWTTLVIGRDR